MLHLLSGEMSLELGLKFAYTPFLNSKQVSKNVFVCLVFFFSLSLSLFKEQKSLGQIKNFFLFVLGNTFLNLSEVFIKNP